MNQTKLFPIINSNIKSTPVLQYQCSGIYSLHMRELNDNFMKTGA